MLHDPQQHDQSTTLGYGVPQVYAVLGVACPQCRAPIGTPCTRRDRRDRHAGRTDRMLRLGVRETEAEVRRRQQADTEGRSWNLWCNAPAHPCGTPGVHTMAECTPLEAGR